MRDFTEIIDTYSRESIPLVKTLGIHVTEAVITDTEVRAVCSLPDRPEQRNHVGVRTPEPCLPPQRAPAAG